MTPQHTPGPWKVDEGDASFVVNAEGVAVAEVANPAWPRDVEEANARLIAAAPRMLDALRAILRRYDELATGRTHAHIQFQNEVEPARALLRDVQGEGPRFDIRLWCQECNAVIGTVEKVAGNNPGDRVSAAMRDHILTEHADLLRDVEG